MDWILTPESSNVAMFAYDADSQVLKVQFKNGSTYDYFDVPDRIYEGMQRAASKGGFLAQEIKGRYRYARV